MDNTLILTMAAVGVAGMAAVLGIWMERDRTKPPRYAYSLSVLILLATAVSLGQAYMDSLQGEKLEEDMARMLQTLDKLAADSDDPALQNLVQSELAAQSRANPEVVEKLAQRVSDAGEDPAEMLGKHLSESEVEGLSRSAKIKPKSKKKKTETEVAKAEEEAKPSKEAAIAPVPVGKRPGLGIAGGKGAARPTLPFAKGKAGGKFGKLGKKGGADTKVGGADQASPAPAGLPKPGKAAGRPGKRPGKAGGRPGKGLKRGKGKKGRPGKTGKGG